MTLRESIQNLIRTDCAESPTDLIFIFGSLVLFGLLVYATQAKITIPHIDAVLLFLVGCKTVKVGRDYVKGKANAATTEQPVSQ